MSKNTLVIGFAGRAGVGKSWATEATLARIEEEYPNEPSLRVYRYSFAGPLKALFASLWPDLRLEDKRKVPAVREGLQLLGSALRAAFPHPPTTTALVEFVRELPEDGLNVVLVDDVRFPDEVLTIQGQLEGYVLGIAGTGDLSGSAAQHESERLVLAPDAYLPDSRVAAQVAAALTFSVAYASSVMCDEPYLTEGAMNEASDLVVATYCCAWSDAYAMLDALGLDPEEPFSEFLSNATAHTRLREAVERGAVWAGPLLAAATQARKALGRKS